MGSFQAYFVACLVPATAAGHVVSGYLCGKSTHGCRGLADFKLEWVSGILNSTHVTGRQLLGEQAYVYRLAAPYNLLGRLFTRMRSRP
jgi:hypothetical protein